MRHQHAGRKLGVSAPRRHALLRSLTLALLEKGSIQTTPARAKELRFFADRVVTLGKMGDLSSRRRIIQMLGSTQTYERGENRIRKVMDLLYNNWIPKLKNRTGGYTQIVRLPYRRKGDNAELCIIRYMIEVDAKKKKESGKVSAKPKKEKKTDKKLSAKPSEDKKVAEK